MIHLTCLVDGLHRVAEEVRVSNNQVNLLISDVKGIY